MLWRKMLGIALVVLGAGSVSALADDFMPPEFRGDELTVMAEWDFLQNFTIEPYDYYNYPPDQLVTVGDGIHELGDAFTHAHFTETMFWREGEAYTLDQWGQIDFYVVNWTDPYPYKHLWIQITFRGAGVPYVGSIIAPNPQTGSWTDPSEGSPQDRIEVNPNQRVEYWVLQPNPDREHIYLDVPPDTVVEQVLIDTISTPSPVSADETTLDGIKALFR